MLVTAILCCVLSGRVWCKWCLILSVSCIVIFFFYSLVCNYSWWVTSTSTRTHV